jgi:hypothetical protein
MSATQKPTGGDVDPDEAPDQVSPIPDEDGPHDVPDEQVIEKTLPTAPMPDSGGSGAP